MASLPKHYVSNKFSEYMNQLYHDKNPCQHRCTLVKKTRSPTKASVWTKGAYQVYVYLMLLPYNHYDTKIYHDSIDSVEHARREHVKNYPFMMHPLSRITLVFNMFVFLPYLLVKFYFATIASFKLPCYLGLSIFLLVIGLLFIIFNMLTGYCKKKEKQVVLNPLQVIKHYMVTYFIVDLGMILPHILHVTFNVTDFGWGGFVYLITFFRSITVVNMVESICLAVSLRRKIVNRVSLVIKILVLLQGVTCLTSLAERLYGLLDYTISTPDWKDDFAAYAAEFIAKLSKLYSSTYEPHQDRLFVTILILILVLVGTIVFSYVMAAVLMDILAGVAQETKYNQFASEVQNFARQEQRDPVISKRIVQMFDVIFLGTLLKEQRVKQTIPDNMRRDLNAETVGVLVRNTSILSTLDDYLLLRILDKLKLVVILPLDHLVTEGQFGDAMYFISAGRLVRYHQNNELGHLDDGDNFAEDALFSEEFLYPETVIAGTPCFVYRLSRMDYQNAFK